MMVNRLSQRYFKCLIKKISQLGITTTKKLVFTWRYEISKDFENHLESLGDCRNSHKIIIYAKIPK
jgi:hypothetical protein